MSLLSSKTLKSVKRSPVVTVNASVTAAEALALARKNQVHHLPVMEDGRLVGLVCTCDLYESVDADLVKKAMSSPPVTLGDADSVLAAAQRIKNEGIGSIVIVDEVGAPSGIVTRGDLLQSDDDAKNLLDDCRCVCCGLTRHLKADKHGQLLCIYCHERATDGSWLDLGDGD